MRTIILAGMLIFLGLNNGLAAQQTQQPKAEPGAVTEPEIEWVWGEVLAVDNAAGKLVVKYLDYETYEEKEIDITTDDKTVYENVASLLEIKPTDSVSIDYIITKENINLAKNISVERPEPEQ